MNCAEFNTSILVPAFNWFTPICPRVPVTRDVHVLMLAIAGQEGGWTYRVQANNGPAHGFWQFERRGGVAAVLGDTVTQAFAKLLCAQVSIPADSTMVWGLLATEKGDNLAAGFARLLLWSDPEPIPPASDTVGTWEYYRRNWRPGAARPRAWANNLSQANAAADAVVEPVPTEAPST